MIPNALLFLSNKPPTQLVELGLHIQRVVPNEVRELDATTAHWVYFVPAALLDHPEWSSLRVELSQAEPLVCRVW